MPGKWPTFLGFYAGMWWVTQLGVWWLGARWHRPAACGGAAWGRAQYTASSSRCNLEGNPPSLRLKCMLNNGTCRSFVVSRRCTCRAVQNFIRPLRIPLAIAMAPPFEIAMQKISEKTGGCACPRALVS